MIGLIWKASRGYRFYPWRSPYLRWRIETYQGLHAEKITAPVFWRFVWENRRDLFRYLRWASRMRRVASEADASAPGASRGRGSFFEEPAGPAIDHNGRS